MQHYVLGALLVATIFAMGVAIFRLVRSRSGARVMETMLISGVVIIVLSLHNAADWPFISGFDAALGLVLVIMAGAMLLRRRGGTSQAR